MAKSNPRWGYTRIRGALSNLGHTVARSTIANILREHGIEPAPERGERTPWRTFLAAHWETVAATDFFTVEVATVRRLVTYYVLVVNDRRMLRLTRERSRRYALVVRGSVKLEPEAMLSSIRHFVSRSPAFAIARRVLGMYRRQKYERKIARFLRERTGRADRLPQGAVYEGTMRCNLHCGFCWVGDLLNLEGEWREELPPRRTSLRVPRQGRISDKPDGWRDLHAKGHF